MMISAAVLVRGRRIYILWAVDVTLIALALAAASYVPLEGYTEAQRAVTESVGLLFFSAAAVGLTRTLAGKLREADITRRVMEGELLAERRRTRALFELSNDGMVVTDAGLRIIHASMQNQRITGYGDDARLGRSLFDLVLAEDRAKAVSAYRHVMENPRSVVPIEIRITRRDGFVRLLSGTIRNCIDNPDLQGLVFNFRDVTDERAAQDALEHANDRLAEMVRSKDEFVAAVSHELRTPLTAVVGVAEIINEEVGLAEDERRELYAILVSQARHTSAIVDDLLVAARADIGQVSVAAVRCDLASIVADAIGSTASDLEVSVDVSPDLIVVADPTRVLQVVRNLVTNADRHGGLRLAISATAGDDLVLLSVSDDGSGVPNEDVERIFEPYRRSGSATTMPGSIGLGLHVSRILARLMGGDVVYRREGDLTVFEFSIPRHVAAGGNHLVAAERSVAVKPA
jgi:PAS domain S-box-containing protein